MRCCAGSVQYRSNSGKMCYIMQIILKGPTRQHEEDHTDHTRSGIYLMALKYLDRQVGMVCTRSVHDLLARGVFWVSLSLGCACSWLIDFEACSSSCCTFFYFPSLHLLSSPFIFLPHSPVNITGGHSK